MRDFLPWLAQGDVFERVPLYEPVHEHSGLIQASMVDGPALLLTHDCAMDKPDQSGRRPKLEFVQFFRLRDMNNLPRDIQARLRQRQPAPYNAILVGEPEGLPESYVSLDDPFFLPFSFFGPRLESFPGHPERADDNSPVAVPTANDTRVGRMDEVDLALLHRKLVLTYVRRDPVFED